MGKILRWLALIPACIAAWYVALFLGLVLRSFLFSLCPPDLVSYGIFCDAAWFQPAETTLIAICAGISAALVVFTAVVTAPTHRVTVAWIALASGILVATVMGIRTELYAALASAVVAGFFSVATVLRFAKPAEKVSRDVA